MPVLPDGKPLPVRRKDAAYDTDKNRAARKGRLSPPFSVKFFRLPAVKVRGDRCVKHIEQHLF